MTRSFLPPDLPNPRAVREIRAHRRNLIVATIAVSWIVTALAMGVATMIAVSLYAPTIVLLWLAIPTAVLWAGLLLAVLTLVVFVLGGG